MSRYKINLDTMTDIREFVNICEQIDAKIHLESSEGFRVSAKSLLGAVASMEWNDVYCSSDHDIYTKIQKFVID